MLGLKKSPLKTSKHNSVDPARVSASRSNPFDSNDEFDNKQTLKPSRTSSEPTLSPPNFGTNPFDDDGGRVNSSSSYGQSSASRNKYKNDFRDSGGPENQSVQELENYATYKAEETTTENKLHGLIMWLLALIMTLVGREAFGKSWRAVLQNLEAKEDSSIVGPVITRDDLQKSSGHLEQRETGIECSSKRSFESRTPPPESTDAFQKVEFQKAKQDDALSDLSDILGELKVMAVDMGSEIESNQSSDGVQDDGCSKYPCRVRINELADYLGSRVCSVVILLMRFALLALMPPCF
ncbi:hypothetical protein F3Y22_tig00113724pilonHSYRG00188 [Hibiscus syriacus]|uniref:Uncharacterized protein n=1 Tax=Hibiscus syriacus TaxID=106335 RepID=A0A6A2WN38_HIBSY|nr:hypothetical protein F3Y22_tig00113724pilonHSYRG00188 [Hibiscus syriacus]